MNTTLKYILYGLGAVAIGGGAYLLVTSFANKNDESGFDEIEENGAVDQTTNSTPKTGYSSTPTVSTPVIQNTFPLKKWSRGPLVRAMQSALNQHYGASLVVDGVLGPNTEAAAIAAGFPSLISEDQYRKLLAGKKEQSEPENTTTNSTPKPSQWKLDPLRMANIFHWAIKAHNFAKVRELLTLMKSVNDYKSVRKYFMAVEMADGKKRTLLDGLFYKFKTSWGRKILSDHFHRMGLKHDGKTWSLSGTPRVLFNQIKTIHASKVWNNLKQTIKVPKGTILGEFVSAHDGVTKFRTLDGKMLYTGTLNIQYV